MVNFKCNDIFTLEKNKFYHVVVFLYFCIFNISFLMKKTLPILLMMLMLAPVRAQLGERTLNRRYQNEIRDSLTRVVSERQREMQRYAERWLTQLPNEEKLYDESYISVGADLIDTFYEDGRMRLDLVYRLSYNSKHLEGWTDDYPLGTFDVDSSNSCRAICRLTEYFVDNMLADIFSRGSEVEVIVSSSADGTEFTSAMPYDGRYGEFRYCPVTFNGERLRISVERATGICNNCQLAYLRTQSVRTWLEEHVTALSGLEKEWRYVTQSFKDSIHTHYYRRSSIEMRISNVFAETVSKMQAARMQDDHVDFNIPVTKIQNNDKYVLIIANEEYDTPLIPSVPYALHDGEVVRQYFIKALGVPERQVKLLKNASKAEIEQEGIHWLTDLAKAVARKQGENTVPVADVVIYYTGHGFTDLDGNAYLMPNRINTADLEVLRGGKKSGGCKLFGKKKTKADTVVYDIVLSKKEVSRLAKECLAIEDLCANFNSKTLPVKELTLVVDASFDGNQRDGKPMVRADQPTDNKKKRRKASLRSDAVVLLAADYDKTAYAFDTHEHGFLTYFLLKEIKSQKDNIFRMNYQDIYDAVERKLNKESALQNKWQEASGVAGGKYKDGSWKELKIKN